MSFTAPLINLTHPCGLHTSTKNPPNTSRFQKHRDFKHDELKLYLNLITVLCGHTFSFGLHSNRSFSIWRTCLITIRCVSRPSSLWPKTSSVCPTDERTSWWVTWALTVYLRPMELYPRAKPRADSRTEVHDPNHLAIRHSRPISGTIKNIHIKDWLFRQINHCWLTWGQPRPFLDLLLQILPLNIQSCYLDTFILKPAVLWKCSLSEEPYKELKKTMF